MNVRIRPLFCLTISLVLLLTGCQVDDEGTILSGPVESGGLRTEAVGEGVTLVRNTVRQALAAGEIETLAAGERLVVAGNGRATLQRDDLLTVDLLQPGELILESVAEEQFTALTLRQPAGTIFYSFNLDKSVDHRLTVETNFATISSTGARFVVAQASDKLEWVVNVGQAAQLLEVTAGGATEVIPSGTARWLSFNQPPGEARSVEIEPLEAWLAALRIGQPQPALSDLLFDAADLTGEMGSLTTLPAVGQPFAVGGGGPQGAVLVTLDTVGLFGRPTYALEDCDGNGSQEISVAAGQVHFDFSEVLAQTQALDVTVINRDLPGNGALWGLDAGQNELGRVLLNGGEALQTLSLRLPESLHTAQLALVDGCLVGLSLTPPPATGGPAPPRPVTAGAQSSGVVVNLLATAEPDATEAAGEEPALPGLARQGEPLVAESAGSIQIDGDSDDWPADGWTRFDRTVYDDGCASRYPGGEALVDLSGQVRFVYDADFLYVAFQVEDDGYVGYSGDGQEYFLGDSPQLSLDLDLLGDYTEPNRNNDDWQVDFWPDPAAPQAVLWQLGSLSARPFEEARVASRFDGANYFLEAVLPWRSFGLAAPEPGTRIGLAANINDNDTPNTNAQECIISTAPQREWNNPTSWGILLLEPAPE